VVTLREREFLFSQQPKPVGFKTKSWNEARTPRKVRILECSSSKRWSFCDSYTSSTFPREVDIIDK